MWYIYELNGIILHRKDVRPKEQKVIELERMPPKPNKKGFESVLNADFKTEKVWYNLLPIPLTLEQVRGAKIAEINAHDISDNVNSFSLASTRMWLDKATRVGLSNSISIEQESGKTATTLWFNAVRYDIPISLAMGMLNSLELYALECYNVTQGHIAAVLELESIEEVMAYDYTAGYPAKLVLNLND